MSTEPEVHVVTVQDRILVAVQDTVQQVVHAGQAGPRGPQGAVGASGNTSFTKTAAQALGGHRVVRLISAAAVDYADNATLAHGDDVLGVTTGAASLGADVTVVRTGEITEPSWNWTALEPLFLGRNGLLTQTAPSLAAGDVFSLQVGVALSATTALIDIDSAIYL